MLLTQQHSNSGPSISHEMVKESASVMGAKRRERESHAGGTRKTCVSKLCLERLVGFDLRIWEREGRGGTGKIC